MRPVIILTALLVMLSCKPNGEKPDSTIENFRFIESNIAQIRKDLNSGSYTITDLVKAYLDRIEAVDHHGPELNSVITVNPDALQIAAELDRELKEGKIRGPLHGIPVIIKDNIATHDKMPNTAGSRALSNSFPLEDSYLVRKLREAGAVILGKANLSEWANFRGQLSTSGWSGAGGLTKNPYELSRNPCGSSSGSAVAVSANLTVLAIGTETNGSIVCPCNNNGIVGIKPTVGLISRSGIIPISFTQDTPGPMARTVEDAAICLGALTGIDSLDSRTQESAGKSYTDYTQFLKADGLKGKRIGLFKGTFGVNFKVDSVMMTAIRFLKSQGAEIIEIKNILDPQTENTSFQVMLYEYKDGLNRYFASLGPNAPVKTIDDLIAYNKNDSIELRFFDQLYLEMAQKKGGLDSREYQEALKTMLKYSREMGVDKVMNDNHLDAIISETGAPAWKTDLVNGDSYQIGSSSPAAISGYPSITVPMGNVSGLPVGITFTGRAWSEPVLIEIAYAYEQGTKHRQIPQFKQ